MTLFTRYPFSSIRSALGAASLTGTLLAFGGCSTDPGDIDDDVGPGAQECSVAQTACDGVCVDILSASDSCGGCGMVCSSDELCSSGMCVPATQGCLAPATECAGGCVDVATSVAHCGSCNAPCSSGQSCEGGECQARGGGAGGSGSGGGASGGAAMGSGGFGSATGGVDNGGGNSGGASAGGNGTGGGMAIGGSEAVGGMGNETGGAGSGGNQGSGSTLADEYPCDGSTDGYDVVVSGGGNDWTITGGGGEQSISTGLEAALSSAYGRISGSAGNNGTVLVQGDGTIDASSQLKMPSYMLLNICGTVDVTGSATGSDRSPFYARDRTDIQIPHLTLTGNAQYGMFFRDVSNLHLGDIYINGTGGLGIRIDSNGSNNRANAKNIAIDTVHVENTGGHGVEFYGVDGIEIGTVVARRTADCGLILNRSINANIGLVDAVDAAHIGTGYAAFRTANNNGQYDDGSYPTNIRLGELRASGGDAGRGFFCVSQSGGVEIAEFTIDGVGGDPAIFVENCYNVTMASSDGSGALVGGRAYIGHNSGNGDPARDVTFQNITLSGGASISASGDTCGGGNQVINVSGGTANVCN